MNNILICGEQSEKLASRIIYGIICNYNTQLIIYNQSGMLNMYDCIAERISLDIDFVYRLRAINKTADLRQRELSEGVSLDKRKYICIVVPEFCDVYRSPYRKDIIRELTSLLYCTADIHINMIICSRYATSQVFPPSFLRLFGERWATKLLTPSESRHIIGSGEAVNLLPDWALCRDIYGLHKIRIEPIESKELY